MLAFVEYMAASSWDSLKLDNLYLVACYSKNFNFETAAFKKCDFARL
jgi:hypothetical protein